MLKGKKHSFKSIQKMIDSHKGKRFNQEHKSNLAQSYISDLENNQCSPPIRVLFRMSNALCICPLLLLNYDCKFTNDCRDNCSG